MDAVYLVLLGISLQLPYEFLVGSGCTNPTEIKVAALRFDFLADPAHFLHLRLHGSILLNEKAVHVVELGLQRYPKVVGNVLHFSLEITKVVVEPSLLLFNAILERSDVPLFFPQQKQQLLWEYLCVVDNRGEVAVLAGR